MANFGNSWLEEFERIAVEKGWNIRKEARFQGPLAEKIQNGINEVASKFTGFDPKVAALRVTVDKDFGPKSMAALDVIRQAISKPEFTSLYPERELDEVMVKLTAPEGNAQLWDEGIVRLLSLFLDAGKPAQRYVEAYKAKTEGITDHIPGQEQPAAPAVKPVEPFLKDTMPALKEVSTPEQSKEFIMNPKTSAVIISRLVALANDLDAMGAEDAALAVDRRLVLYKEAVDKLYDVHGETGDKLVEMAHPGGGPVLVPAKDEGGKVETIVEEHKKMVDRSTKKPTGKIAEVIQKLVVRANALEDAGEIEAARAVDRAIEQLREVSLPFVNRGTALEAAGSEYKNASIKIAIDSEELKKQLMNKFSVLVSKVMLIEEFIDNFGTAASQMKRLFQNVKNIYKQTKQQEDQLSVKDIAIKVKEAANLIVSTDININDAFGSSDAVYFWPVDKLSRQIVEFVNKVISVPTEKNLPMENKGKQTDMPAKEDISKTNPNLNKYRYWLKNLMNLLAYNKEVRKFLGAGNEKIGYGHIKTLYDWAGTELKIDYNPVDAAQQHDELWAKVLTPLKKFLPEKTTASVKLFGKTLYKVSAPPPLVVNPSGGVISGRPTSNKPAGVRTVRENPIKKLQQAMVGVGIQLEGVGDRNPIDGVWGPKTHAAYNELRQKVLDYLKEELPAASDKQAPGEIGKAIQLANQLSGGASWKFADTLEIAPGKVISSEALLSVKKLLAALVSAGVIQGGENQNSDAISVLDEFGVRARTMPQFHSYLQHNFDIQKLENLLGNLKGQLSQLNKSAPNGFVGRPSGDLIDPFERETAGRTAGSPTSVNQKKLNFGNSGGFISFDPSDAQSVVNAINNLNPSEVENVTTAVGSGAITERSLQAVKALQNQLMSLWKAFRASIRPNGQHRAEYDRLSRQFLHYFQQVEQLKHEAF